MNMPKRACLAIGVLAPICGEPPAGEVSGKITFGGEPLNAGTVAFVGADGHVTSGTIEAGSYRLVKVPLGPARVTVFVSAPSMPIVPLDVIKKGTAPPTSAPQKKALAVPKRYQDASLSGLTHTVVAGKQSFDIVLQP
jgi:hypothetical protein